MNFKNLSIKSKLLLLVSFPTLLLLCFAASLALQKTEEYRALKDVDGLVAFSTRCGDLVHELQKERGMTAGFIGKGGQNPRSTASVESAIVRCKWAIASCEAAA